jgi:hypothetical protein
MQKKILDDDFLDKVISREPILDREKKGRYWLTTLYSKVKGKVLDQKDLEDFRQNIINAFTKIDTLVGQLNTGSESDEKYIQYAVVFKESVAYLKGIEHNNVFPGMYYYLSNSGYNIYNSYVLRLETRVEGSEPVYYGIEFSNILPYKRVVTSGIKSGEGKRVEKVEGNLSKVVENVDFMMKAIEGDKQSGSDDKGLIGDMNEVLDEIYMKDIGLKDVVAGLVKRVDEIEAKHKREIEELGGLVTAMGTRFTEQETKYEKESASREGNIKELEGQIGELKIELDMMKKQFGLVDEELEVVEKVPVVEVGKSKSSTSPIRRAISPPIKRRTPVDESPERVANSPEIIIRTPGRKTPVRNPSSRVATKIVKDTGGIRKGNFGNQGRKF